MNRWAIEKTWWDRPSRLVVCHAQQNQDGLEARDG